MPQYLVRKTESHHLLVDADSADDAEERAADVPDHDWEQSDGPTFEAEPAETGA